MSKNLFVGSANEIVEGVNKIEITKNTVRFGTDVYQLKNVTGFGMVIIKKRTIPGAIIVLIFFIGLLMLLMGVELYNQEVTYSGIFLIVLGVCFIIYKALFVPTYGLKLYLPSNEDKIFFSKDGEGIKQIVACLYEFMERENNSKAVVKIIIDERHARVDVGYAER